MTVLVAAPVVVLVVLHVAVFVAWRRITRPPQESLEESVHEAAGERGGGGGGLRVVRGSPVALAAQLRSDEP